MDTPPELRLQLVREGVDRVHAVWITHLHADHIHGIDDLRIFSLRYGEGMTVWVPEGEEAELRGRFPYIFEGAPPPGSSLPEFRLAAYREGVAEEILGERFLPLAVPHGPTTVYGFRVGALGYITDGKRLPPATLEALEGVEVLVLNALWHGDPHPAHFNVEEAVEAARRVGARRTYLTHLTHRLRHEELVEWLPEGIEPAYDGLTVEVG